MTIDVFASVVSIPKPYCVRPLTPFDQTDRHPHTVFYISRHFLPFDITDVFYSHSNLDIIIFRSPFFVATDSFCHRAVKNGWYGCHTNIVCVVLVQFLWRAVRLFENARLLFLCRKGFREIWWAVDIFEAT